MGRLKEIATQTAKLATDLFLDTISFFVALIPQFPVIFILIGIGILLVLFRLAFLISIPILLDLTSPLVIIIDAIIFFLRLFVNAIVVVIIAIIDILKTFGLTNDSPPGLVNIDTISDSEFRAALVLLPITCIHYNNADLVFQAIIRTVSDEYVCTNHRYLYPYVPFYATTDPLAYFYYGSSDAIPQDPVDNCNARHILTAADGICIGLGAGYM
jgi:hypothetical protein